MPHCVIEYSQQLGVELDPQLMINAAHQGAYASGLFEESHIKSRAISYQYYKTGTNDNLRFIHITARILSGRNTKQKLVLSQKILAQFETFLLDNSLSKISVTVDVRELQREVYTKVIL